MRRPNPNAKAAGRAKILADAKSSEMDTAAGVKVSSGKPGSFPAGGTEGMSKLGGGRTYPGLLKKSGPTRSAGKRGGTNR